MPTRSWCKPVRERPRWEYRRARAYRGATAAETLIAQYNNLDSVTQRFRDHRGEIAAVIVEPIAGNMGVVPPAQGFLEGLRTLADRYSSLLIFDEVISGFRVGKGGAQTHYGVRPDLTCLGKIIGGGCRLVPMGVVLT